MGLSFPSLIVPEKLSLSHSCIKTWQKCRRAWLFKYIARLKSKRLSVPLFIGDFFHACVARFYGKQKPDDFMEDVIVQMEDKIKGAHFLDPEQEEELNHSVQVVEAIVRGYCKRYRKDLKKWKIIKPEFPFYLSIRDNTLYVGIIDLLVEIDGELWVVEHKTVGRLDKNYIKRLPLDTQITGYAVGAKHVMQKPIAGVIYNVMKKPQLRQKKTESKQQFTDRVVDDITNKRPDFYFYREQLYRDKRDSRVYRAEVIEISKDIWRCLRALDEMGDEALVKFYRNTNACTQMGLCEFFDICTNGWAESKRLFEVAKKFNQEFERVEEE